MPESILDISQAPSRFPHQKRSDKEKTEKFFKECVDAGINIVNFNHNLASSKTVRAPRDTKLSNYKIYNGEVDPEEIERVVNPFKIQFGDLPTTYRNYPLINPNIDLLLGEERKRYYKPFFLNVNEDATTEEIRKANEKLMDIAVESITGENLDEERLEKELRRHEKERKYTIKDTNTRMANQVVDYLYRSLGLKEEYSRGFEDLLISSDEIFVTDIVAGEPVQWKGNPLNIFSIGSGESYKIEDSSIITEDGYIPIGTVIDRYHDHLSDRQIRDLEKGKSGVKGTYADMFANQQTHKPINLDHFVQEAGGIGKIVNASHQGVLNFGGAYDEEGNIRVTRVLWKGMRKVGVREYWDEFGNYQKEFVPEQYEPKLERGEQVDWIWISEWNEGTRIGNDIYVKLGPREVQIRSMDNPSKCHPGVVGSVLNVNSSVGRSMVDMMKVYQYLYNAIMTKTEDALAKYLGKVGRVNAALIPDGWSMDQFLYYMYTMNIQFEDPFNEGQKGAATGKLAGNMSQTSKDTEIGDPQSIQQNVLMLDFIERRVDAITGITPQRKGAIQNRETVGGVERSVMQSSHTTEKWFSIHDDTKTRALVVLLETAKIAWKDKSFKRAYVLDDGTKRFLDFDGKKFSTAEFGSVLTTDSEDTNMMERMKQLSEHMIQNQTPISMIMELYKTKDPSDLQRKIESYEEERAEQEQKQMEMEQQQLQEAQQQQQELEMMKIDIEQQNAELDRELEQYKVDRDNETKIAVEQIRNYRHQDDWQDTGEATPEDIAEQAIKRQDVESKHFDKQQEIKQKEDDSKRKKELEERKIKLDEKKAEINKQIEEKKLKIEEKKIQADKDKTKAVEKGKQMKYTQPKSNKK